MLVTVHVSSLTDRFRRRIRETSLILSTLNLFLDIQQNTERSKSGLSGKCTEKLSQQPLFGSRPVLKLQTIECRICSISKKCFWERFHTFFFRRTLGANYRNCNAFSCNDACSAKNTFYLRERRASNSAWMPWNLSQMLAIESKVSSQFYKEDSAQNELRRQDSAFTSDAFFLKFNWMLQTIPFFVLGQAWL